MGILRIERVYKSLKIKQHFIKNIKFVLRPKSQIDGGCIFYKKKPLFHFVNKKYKAKQKKRY